MADPELVRTLDYILNRCDEQAIEAVSAAVVRRRRDLALFSGLHNLPNPQKMAQELAGQINNAATIEGLKETVRSMAVRIIRREAPDLTDEQIGQLMQSWVPLEEHASGDALGLSGGDNLPPDLLEVMIRQFVAYSRGEMSPQEDQRLRNEMDQWPDRYWNAFPPVIRLIIRDYINNKISEQQFWRNIQTASSL